MSNQARQVAGEGFHGDDAVCVQSCAVRTIEAAVRLIIASSVRLVREGLTESLRGRAGLVVVDAVNLDAAGLARIAEAAPDVVLVDLAQRDAATTARLVKAAGARAKLLAFALAEIDDDVFACAAAGFSGYVPQESNADDLYHALVDMVHGRMRCAPHISAAMFSRLADLLRDVGPQASLPILTSRESEILTLAEKGSSNKEIARCLRISCATVKNHMHNILQKLQVKRRGQAVARLRAGANGFQ
jgi:two-component system nitrate/nitrite response regulator NarL